MGDRRQRDHRTLLHFAGGVVAGIAGAYLYDALKPGRRFSPKLLRESREHPDLPATVILPGIMGSRLQRPDGSEAWLNVGNVFMKCTNYGFDGNPFTNVCGGTLNGFVERLP